MPKIFRTDETESACLEKSFTETSMTKKSNSSSYQSKLSVQFIAVQSMTLQNTHAVIPDESTTNNKMKHCFNKINTCFYGVR